MKGTCCAGGAELLVYLSQEHSICARGEKRPKSIFELLLEITFLVLTIARKDGSDILLGGFFSNSCSSWCISRN